MSTFSSRVICRSSARRPSGVRTGLVPPPLRRERLHLLELLRDGGLAVGIVRGGRRGAGGDGERKSAERDERRRVRGAGHRKVTTRTMEHPLAVQRCLRASLPFGCPLPNGPVFTRSDGPQPRRVTGRTPVPRGVGSGVAGPVRAVAARRSGRRAATVLRPSPPPPRDGCGGPRCVRRRPGVTAAATHRGLGDRGRSRCDGLGDDGRLGDGVADHADPSDACWPQRHVRPPVRRGRRRPRSRRGSPGSGCGRRR